MATELRYALSGVSNLLCCPFCRELYRPDEASLCPSCGLKLTESEKLPPSYEATLEADWPNEPEWENLPLLYPGRGRAALVLIAALGFAAFWVPWIQMSVPETMTLSGYEISRILGWPWGCAVGWAMMLPTVLSRRSVAKMRGARVAAALFCAVPLMTSLILLLSPPRRGPIPLKFEFGPGLYFTVILAVIALPFALRFGGRLDDLPTAQGSSRGKTLN
jgi:hypothetical protein